MKGEKDMAKFVNATLKAIPPVKHAVRQVVKEIDGPYVLDS